MDVQLQCSLWGLFLLVVVFWKGGWRRVMQKRESLSHRPEEKNKSKCSLRPEEKTK